MAKNLYSVDEKKLAGVSPWKLWDTKESGICSKWENSSLVFIIFPCMEWTTLPLVSLKTMSWQLMGHLQDPGPATLRGSVMLLSSSHSPSPSSPAPWGRNRPSLASKLAIEQGMNLRTAHDWLDFQHGPWHWLALYSGWLSSGDRGGQFGWAIHLFQGKVSFDASWVVPLGHMTKAQPTTQSLCSCAKTSRVETSFH